MTSSSGASGSTGSSGSSGAAPRAGAGAPALLAGAALSGFDGGAIGYVLPVMRAATGADAQAASALVSVFVAGTLVAIAASGVAAARFGARRLFMLCLVLAAASSALATLAPNVPLLLAARLLQGLGLGPLLPLAAAIIALTWPAERAGRMLGALSLVYGSSFVAAMVATPSLLEAAGWRAAFGVSAALSVVALLLLRGGARQPSPTLPDGASVAAAATAASAASAATITSASSARPGAGAADDARLLINRPMLAVAVLSLGTGVGQALLVWLPTLAMARLGVPAASTTVLMLPLAAAGIAATVLITALMDRTGARALLACSAVATLAGMLLAAALPPTSAAFMAGTGLFGLGISGLSGGPLRYAAAHAVAARGQSLAQSAVALLTNVGLLVGSMALGWLAVRQADERAAIEQALLLGTAAMAVLFTAVLLLPGRRASPSPPPLEENP